MVHWGGTTWREIRFKPGSVCKDASLVRDAAASLSGGCGVRLLDNGDRGGGLFAVFSQLAIISGDLLQCGGRDLLR